MPFTSIQPVHNFAQVEYDRNQLAQSLSHVSRQRYVSQQIFSLYLSLTHGLGFSALLGNSDNNHPWLTIGSGHQR